MPVENSSAASNVHQITQSTVLIVEDDVATRRLYKFLLSNSGYAVLEAEDGIAALEIIDKQPCSLVITDMNMPRMDGLQLIKELRQRNNAIQIIVITAFGTPDTERQAMRIGANHYLPKPFDFEQLERYVKMALSHASNAPAA